MAESIAYNRDCLEYMKTLPDNAFALAVADPPYGVKYARGENGWGVCDNRPALADVAWDEVPSQEVFDEIRRVSVNQVVWGGQYFTDKLPVSKCWIVWDKICDTENKSVFSDCEMAWTSFTKVCRLYKFRQMGFISDTKLERIHPTEKPIELYRWLYANYAQPGDTIFDPFLGSGTSRLAAWEAGLDFVGCEISKEYFEAQEQRFADYTAQMSLFI